MRRTIVSLALGLLVAAPVSAAPLTAAKSSVLVSDPITGAVLPKRIPGALVDYNIRVDNPNSALTTIGGVSVGDHIPAGTALYVGNLGLAGSWPVTCSDGALLGLLFGSGLTYSYVSLSNTGDSLAFSNNNGASYTYVPVPDADGFDANVTDVRINPSGTQTAGSAFNLRFRVRVR